MQNEDIIAGLGEIVSGKGVKKEHVEAAQNAIEHINTLAAENSRIVSEHPEYAELKANHDSKVASLEATIADKETELANQAAEIEQLTGKLEKASKGGDSDVAKQLEAQKEANRELMSQLEAARRAQGKPRPTISVGSKVYRAKAGRWLDRLVKENKGTNKFVSLEDCKDDEGLLSRSIALGMVVEEEEGGGNG
jgi:chromosome segregation ATPase